MTPSNSHPGTAVRGPRRAFLLRAASVLLTALFTAPAPAVAQNVIQFSVGLGPFTRYEYRDDGTGLRTLAFPSSSELRIDATTRSDYYNGSQYIGRQYLYVQPDSSGRPAGTLMVWSEATGQSKALTNFPAPYAVYISGNVWSNDGQDSFVSFILQNETTGQVEYTYRLNCSATDIALATYTPVTLGDPHLEIVKDWQSVGATTTYWWNHSGSGFYYCDPRDASKIRLKTVGVGVTVDDDLLVFTAPTGLLELRVGPPVDPQNPDRYLVASTLNTGTVGNGTLAIDLLGSWRWLATQPTWTVSGIRGPCFSPDGTQIAFGNTRFVKTRGNQAAPYYGVYTVPFIGGPISGPVTEVMGSSKTTAFLTVNNWNTP
jgi:hypothetical protein